MASIGNIGRLGIKELRGLARDRVMVVLILYIFTLGIYVAATIMPETLHNTPIAITDEDGSQASQRLVDVFFPPRFQLAALIPLSRIDIGLDRGDFTFALDIPPNFERDLLAGRHPTAQLNVDANRMIQAFAGSVYIQSMVTREVANYLARDRPPPRPAIDMVLRARYNPSLTEAWYLGVMELVNDVAMLSIILTGAALIRERERGTIEHLLVMPISPFEIMMAKIWSMGLVVLIGSTISLLVVTRGFLAIPIEGSLPLFLFGASLTIFATTSLGILMGTLARSMQQFGIMAILVLIPLQMLSGGVTARESMPTIVQHVMMIAPTTHFVLLAQSILYRGAGIGVVWPQLMALVIIGALFFTGTLWWFRGAMKNMA